MKVGSSKTVIAIIKKAYFLAHRDINIIL